MARTLRDKFELALLKRGEREVKRTHKYIVFSRALGGFYYLGKSGSLRFGATIAGSIPVGEWLKVQLLAEGE